MFLKNNSDFKCGLRTKKEILTLAPNDIVFVLESDIISINSKLIKVTEKDYQEFLSAKDEVVVNNEPQPVVQKEENKPEDQNNGEVVENQSQEEKSEEDKEPVKEESLDSLEALLDDLKKQWEAASRPKRKEAIQKEIKEVQEKINKLK